MQKKEVKDLGYEFINSLSISNSPYLFYPYLCDQSLETRGFHLDAEAFRVQKSSIVENDDLIIQKFDIQSDLEDILDKCIPEHNIW